MSKHEKWTCMICNKNKVNVTVASDGSHYLPWGNNRPVCKNQECQDKMREKMEEHNQQQNKQATEEILKQIQEIIDRKEKLTIDFEKYDLTEEQKEICRKYVKTFKGIEDLKKQKVDLSKKQKEELEELSKCQECHQEPSDGKYYEVGGQGTYCKNCAEEKVNDSKTDNNQSGNSSNSPCDKCGLSVVTYYQIGGKGHYCNDCASKLIEESKSNSKNDNLSSDNSSDSSSNKKKNIKYEILNLDDGKKLIKEGKKLDDINFSRLSESEKEELRNYYYENYKNSDDSQREEPVKNSPLPKILIGGVVGVVGLIVFLLIWITKRPTNRKKKVYK